MQDLLVRELNITDLDNGFLESLDSLRVATGISKDEAKEVFEHINTNPNHLVLVAVLNGRIIGSTTLLIEFKFIHNGSKIGHIEDVVVNSKHQGTGAGALLIKEALKMASNAGCYKTILDCNDDVVGFYEKIGFKKTSHAMRFDH